MVLVPEDIRNETQHVWLTSNAKDNAGAMTGGVLDDGAGSLAAA
jgi:hypothetical protein